jgi:hypothetical protein
MYISILSLCLWKGEALNSKNFNRKDAICLEISYNGILLNND